MSKQFAIKEVLNYTIYDYVTKAPIVYTDYATDAIVETKAERLTLRGGQGNYTLIAMDHTKETLFKSKLPLVDLELIAHLTGKALATGATQVPKREVLYASASNTITLSQTPVTGTLKIYLLTDTRDHGTEQTVGTPGTTPNQYSISTATATLNATTAPTGTAFVCYYDYMSSASSRKITLTADKFPAFVRITGEGIMIDQVTAVAYPVVFDIKKAKSKPNFTVTTSATSATEIDLEFDLFAVDIANEKVYLNMTQIV